MALEKEPRKPHRKRTEEIGLTGSREPAYGQSLPNETRIAEDLSADRFAPSYPSIEGLVLVGETNITAALQDHIGVDDQGRRDD